jgi:archaeosine-15-forming tRNA-guanine transglycosylase
MAPRSAAKADTVTRCVARHDGGYLIVTRKGGSGVSASEIPEGVRVVIRDGQAVRAGQ